MFPSPAYPPCTSEYRTLVTAVPVLAIGVTLLPQMMLLSTVTTPLYSLKTVPPEVVAEFPKNEQFVTVGLEAKL